VSEKWYGIHIKKLPCFELGTFGFQSTQNYFHLFAITNLAIRICSLLPAVGSLATIVHSRMLFFLIRIVGGCPNGSTRHGGTEWPIVPYPGDYDNGVFGGMKIGRGNRSTQRTSAAAPLCPPQIPLDQTRARTRAAAVGSQRLTA
jgi:hypothetical protein